MVPIILVSLLMILSPFFSIECSSQPQVPAIYAFGDSLLDAGNNNRFSFFSKANYWPYGINFPTGVTGRFTDGKTFVDFIAGYLGLPFPPAYRGLVRSVTGYTYASAGCGILPQTGSNLMCLSMDRQMELFKKTIDEELAQRFESPTELSQHLADSIFIVWAGSNDYLLNYFSGLSPDYKPDEFAQILIDTLSEKLKILHDMGARKIVVLEVGPLGCLPVYRKNNGQDATWCDEGKNENATMFNTRLAPMMQDLTSAYPDSYFTLGKLYHLTNDVFEHPANYGMSNVSSSCCVTRDVFGNLPCLPLFRPCANPEEYLFWDGAHPTEASHNLLATPCFNGSGVCVPNNIQQLVQLKANTASLLHSAA